MRGRNFIVIDLHSRMDGDLWIFIGRGRAGVGNESRLILRPRDAVIVLRMDLYSFRRARV